LFKKKELPFSHEKIPIMSFMAVPLEREGKIIGVLIVSNRKRSGCRFTKEDEKLLSGLSNDIAIAIINAKLHKNLKDLYFNTVKSLVKTIEAKDPYTGGHSERVMNYALAIGSRMRLHKEAMENVRLSGLLHDIGKVGIKDDILIKNGELSEPEREEISKHPYIGAQIVESIANSRQITRGILEHHERFGGGGYPGGLKGDAISLEARVIAIADAYDALTTDRPYQKSLSAEEAHDMILKGSRTRFDPKIVKFFVASFKKHPKIWRSSD
jgi:putative nucleotidyltransferase with HDIG domain